MKKILYITLLIAGLLSVIGCEGNKQDNVILPENITGQWELKTIDGEPADDRVVFVDIRVQGDFILYQKIWSNKFHKYTGSVEVTEGNGLRFTYSNGDTSGYKSMSIEKKVLATEENPDIPDLIILTLVRESGEINVYHNTTIPEGIIDIAVPATKSADALPFL